MEKLKFNIIPRKIIEVLLLITIFLFYAWPEYFVLKIGSLPGFNIQRVSFLVMLIFWLFVTISSKWHRRLFFTNISKYKKSLILFIILFTIKIISINNSIDLVHSSYVTLNEIIIWFCLMLISLSIWNKPKHIIRVINILAIASVIIFIFGVFELIYGKVVFEDLVGISSKYTSNALSINFRDGHRVKSIFGNTLGLAQFLTILLPFLMFSASSKTTIYLKIFYITTILFSLFLIYKTESRASILIIIILILVWFFIKMIKYFNSSKTIAKYIIFLIIPAFIIFLSFELFNIFSNLVIGKNTLEMTSMIVRVVQLQKGIPLVVNNYLLGYGPGNAASILNVGDANLPTIDNYYLSLSLESGIVSLLIFIIILLLFLKKTFNYMSNTSDISSKICSACFYSLIAFSISLSVLSLKVNFPFIFIIFAFVLVLENYKIEHNK